MKLLAIAILAVFLCGCNETKIRCITTTNEHEFAMWTNAWASENHSGCMKQIRHCKKCGIRQSSISF